MQKLWLNRYAENDSREFKTLIGQYSEDYRTSSQQVRVNNFCSDVVNEWKD